MNTATSAINIPLVPYELPIVVFPANSSIPNRHNAHNSGGAIGLEGLGLHLDSCTARIQALTEELETNVLPAPQVLHRLSSTAAAFRAAYLEVQFPVRLPDGSDRTGQLDYMKAAVPRQDEKTVFGFVVYDEYFQVVRSPQVTAEEFALQVLRTCALLLSDLPFAFIGVDETIALLRTMYLMLSLCQDQLSEPLIRRRTRDEAASPAVAREDDADWSQFWTRGRSRTDLNHCVATFRWKVGHHFFALAAMCCRHTLLSAIEDVRGTNADDAARFTSLAASFLRGTTAAMWYASNFPAEVYQSDVRQQMYRTETQGFSGSQNFDYEQMKETKQQFKDIVLASFGRSVSSWSREKDVSGVLRAAVVQLLETDVEDTEHHTLLAALRVGRNPSLRQAEDYAKTKREQMGKESSQKLELGGVEMLRVLGDGKRSDLEDFITS